MTTISGVDFKKFYSDKKFWPEGVWHDDSVVTVNGEHDPDANLEIVADDAIIRIESGYVMTAEDEEISPLATYYAKWAKEQAYRTVMVEIEHAKVSQLEALVSEIGGKVVS